MVLTANKHKIPPIEVSTLFTINLTAVQEPREIGRERQAAKLEVI